MNESTVMVPAEFDGDYVFICDSDEMTADRIYPGDMLLVKACECAVHGDIAVIQTGDKYLVRRVWQGSNYISFTPSNHKYESIVVFGGEETNIKVVGKVVKAWIDLT